ncbi:MAG: amidase [Longimonas sp.]|uniref:amidase n=1 Tax=Longimonas sp. TaxID=2039626 RepID=UPI003974D6E7
MDRRQFLESCSAVGLTGLMPGVLYTQVADRRDTAVANGVADITTSDIEAAEQLIGLSFNDEERKMLVEALNEQLEQYQAMREHDLPNGAHPAEVFTPQLSGAEVPSGTAEPSWQWPSASVPESDEDLAFASVAQLSVWLREREVTAQQLTELFLNRLRRLDDTLNCVITYTEERAMEAAAQADAELDAGDWRGPLHGVPYGAKDLFAVEGYPTTWGATPYQEQTIDDTAAVVERLGEAGAVLIAKLSLGALAWGDVWFDGQTNSPWNPNQGSSGSSAGSAAAVAAGAVPFALGTETLGSIVSPSTRNGVTGHRPSFGTVSRHGAMVLSWSMDKAGPMARSAYDCALVYDVLRGADPRDPGMVDAPFPFDAEQPLSDLRIGVYEEAFDGDYQNAEADQAVLDALREQGAELHSMSLPTDYPLGALLNTLNVESASNFDELTRSGNDDTMVRQTTDAWPHVFRSARFVPAVEHLQSSRLRRQLMVDTHEALAEVDVFISPSFQGGTLQITNLTGHPCVCLPNAFHPVEDDDGNEHPEHRSPGSITVLGRLYHDADTLRVAHAIQEATDWHTQRPPVR